MNLLRPGDLRHFNLDQEPERRGPAPETRTAQLTPEWIAAYDRMSAAQARHLCETDPQFNALADELYARRHPDGVK
jgi:hypothetical protein